MPADNDFARLLAKTQRYCSKSEKCEADVRNYLINSELDKYQKQEIIDSLKADKFIDEVRYAEAFVNDKFKFYRWGRLKIKNALAAKGIREATVSSAMKKIDDKAYLAVLQSLIDEKFKSCNDENTLAVKQKVFNFAYSRGFEPELIYKFLP